MIHLVAIFAPLVSFFIVGFWANSISKTFGTLLACLLMISSSIAGAYIFYNTAILGNPYSIELCNWIKLGSVHTAWHLNFDTLSSIMVFVITSISTLVHIYSVEYMATDGAINRFMAYLSLFTFMMLMLVTANNFVQLFFGWEGVGLASYLLIGFWHHKESANNASMKAFIVNRVGDLFLILAMGLMLYMFKSLNFSDILSNTALIKDKYITIVGMNLPVAEVLCMCLFLGAMGKSAQLGLHTWLPDAMEGPTPVSALIHAATMVTAGVFLVCKTSALFEMTIFTKQFVLVIGSVTAIFAGTIACTQNDIKRIIAYSTCSQLGYMFAACGVGAYGAAVFHLFTHAFFKALLFLGAGATIHAMSNEQDIRKMGGIASHIKKVYLLMLVGNFALLGIYPFAGYFSKDAILESIWLSNSLFKDMAFTLGIAAAALTAFYSCRLLFIAFHGKVNADPVVVGHIHEPGMFMLIPLVLLGIGAMCSGIVFFDYFMLNHNDFWKDVLVFKPMLSHPPKLIVYAPSIAAVSGIVLAFCLYLVFTSIPKFCSNSFSWIYQLFYNKWYFDEIYDVLFVRGAKLLGTIYWKCIDIAIIDNLGPNGARDLAHLAGRRIVSLNTGYVYHYIALISLAILACVLGFAVF